MIHYKIFEKFLYMIQRFIEINLSNQMHNLFQTMDPFIRFIFI